MRKVIKVLLFVLAAAGATGQTDIELGLFLGAANYQGDLAEDQLQFTETNPAFSGLLRFQVHPNFGLRGNLAFAKLTGDDKNNPGLKNRQFRFKNSLVELSAMGEVYFIKRPTGGDGYSSFNSFKPNASPYFLAGVGLAFGDPKPECYSPECLSGAQKLFPEAGEKSSFLAVPIGVGVRFEPFRSMAVGFEFVYRATFSDYIDGVSQVAGSTANDWYFVTGVTVAYIFRGN
jgi:hypothetical protein